MDINGKALLGASILGVIKNLVVICIDFRDRARISISYVISPAINDTYSRPSGFFINPQVMGFIEQSKIVSWRLDADAPIEITPQHVENSFRAPCLPFGQSLYILPWGSRSDGVVQIVPLPGPDSHRAPIAASPAPSPTALTIQYPGKWSSTTTRSPHVFAPHYGIFAITSRSFTIGQGDEARHLTHIHFRPARASTIHGGDLEFGPDCVYEHRHPISHMAVGASGTYVLVLSQPKHEERYLGLVRFTATPLPRTMFRKLDVGDLSLSSVRRIALDDALGLVLAVDDEGAVAAISYA